MGGKIKITYKKAKSLFDNKNCILLWNEEEFKQNYKNSTINIPFICSCECVKNSSWSNFVRRKICIGKNTEITNKIYFNKKLLITYRRFKCDSFLIDEDNKKYSIKEVRNKPIQIQCNTCNCSELPRP